MDCVVKCQTHTMYFMIINSVDKLLYAKFGQVQKILCNLHYKASN